METIPREARKVNTNSRFHRELRQSLSLSADQKSILFGSLLGDGCLIENSSKSNYRLQFEQSQKQREYLFWKYESFKNFMLSEPRYLARTNSWKVRTVSHPDFSEIRERFYSDRKKVLPADISFLKNPVALAVWYMDDGSYNRGKGYILNTQNFTLSENVRLQKFLNSQFNMDVRLHRDRTYYRLFINRMSMERFKNLIGKEIHPIMCYKL